MLSYYSLFTNGFLCVVLEVIDLIFYIFFDQSFATVFLDI